MGLGKVAQLLYIFLCNWNHRNPCQPLQEDELSGMQKFSDMHTLESLIVQRRNKREKVHLISASM